MLQVPAILGDGLLDGVPSMVEGLPLTVADQRVGVGREMLVLMEPYVNVPPKGCALLLRAMDRINASGQPCITQQLVLTHIEAFSSTPLLWIASIIIRIIILAVLLLLSSGGPLLLCVHVLPGVGAILGVALMCARLGVSSRLGGLQFIHTPILIETSPCPPHG